MGTPLLDRIGKPPKVIELRRQPRWIERMNAGQTKAKDLTPYRNGQTVPSGSDGAA